MMTEYMPVINVGNYQVIFGIGSGLGGFANDTSVRRCAQLPGHLRDQ